MVMIFAITICDKNRDQPFKRGALKHILGVHKLLSMFEVIP